MHKTLQTLVLLVVVLALAVPGMASTEKKYRFEFFGGASFPLDKKFQVGYPQTSQPLNGTHEFSTGARGGVRAGLDTAGHWGQDYTYSYGTNASRIITPNGKLSFTNRFHEATSNVLFYPWNLKKTRAHFFVTAGLGAMWVVVDQKALQQATDPAQAHIGTLSNEVKFSFNAGAGIRFRLSDRFGIRIDVRDYMSPALRYGLPASSTDPNAIVFPVEHTFHQLFGSFSFVIHF
jgi:hypothetical protein